MPGAHYLSAAMLLAAAFLVPAASVRAGDALPACHAEAAGSVACIAEKLCRCRFERGGSLVAAEPGFRWDCGVLRQSCRAPGADRGSRGSENNWLSGTSVPVLVGPPVAKWRGQRPDRTRPTR